MVLPKLKGPVVPARHAYSHSASVGSLIPARSQNRLQSSQLTVSTGSDPEPLKCDGLSPVTFSHSACVTSYLAMRKGESVTSWTGPSYPSPIDSPSGDMRN